MVVAIEQYPRFTPAEYLDWEEQQELRHDYINGEIYGMTGGTMNHSEIAANFITMLRTHLRGSGCRVLTSDAKVAIEKSNDYVYPDLSVTCNDLDRTATRYISSPCLVVEILSPSTEAYDRGDKFNKLYRQLSSLQDYVLIHTNKVAIDLYAKNEQGRWEIVSYGAGETMELKSVGLTFVIEQVFENIVF